MARAEYSIEVCRELLRSIEAADLKIAHRPSRHERGDRLTLDLTAVWPETKGRGVFRIEKFVGGGFAGQVYRCVLESLEPDGAGSLPGLTTGGLYAVKIMLPPSRFSRAFRDRLYWLAFQAPFSAQVSESACRAGLLWPKLARHAARAEFGTQDAVADTYASFYDPTLRAYGEIREWVEGRTWRLEPDSRPRMRRRWRNINPLDTGSPEYVAKRQFMARFVKLLHAMGAPELARQYEWWTLKSQPNVLKRTGQGEGPGDGLCAVDFRAGLALLPFLPMSPADVALILRGIGRGSLAQFDRCDLQKLRRYAETDAGHFRDLAPMIDVLERYDRAYRRSMPDLTHQGWRLLTSPVLRASVRRGLIAGYLASDLVDPRFAGRLEAKPAAFAGFYLLGVVPILGRFLRRLWGSADYRGHVRSLLAGGSYFRRSARAGAASRLVDWHRAGRTGAGRTRFLARHPALFWIQYPTLGILPPSLHRSVAEPSHAVAQFVERVRFVRRFYRDADFRRGWLVDLVQEGRADGMLDEAESQEILARVGDPFIAKYLKCLGVHFATLPLSEIFWTVTAGVVALMAHMKGADVKLAITAVAAFAVACPISPGSLCRGLYVIYLMIKERNVREYLIAAPISFVKIIGYLAFPIQMVTTHPALSRFMASRWATEAVHVVPVFGEKGALLEHWAFDACFNLPRAAGLWARARIRGLLTGWLVLGLGILGYAFGVRHLPLSGEGETGKAGINLILAVVVLCVLPRVLFYPVLKGRGARRG